MKVIVPQHIYTGVKIYTFFFSDFISKIDLNQYYSINTQFVKLTFKKQTHKFKSHYNNKTFNQNQVYKNKVNTKLTL